MPTLAQVYQNIQQIYMNDFAGTTYTTARLGPIVAESFIHLQLFLRGRGDPAFITQLSDSSQFITVAINARTISALDANGYTPINIYERLSGSSDEMIMMERRTWDPTGPQSDTLRYWMWESGAIKFPGATTTRQVRVDYVRGLAIVPDPVSPEAGAFLAAWGASLAAKYIQGNLARSEELKLLANVLMERIIDDKTSTNQALPVCGKRYRGFKQTAW